PPRRPQSRRSRRVRCRPPRRMKLLLFCPHFRPDLHAATGEVMTELVEALAERGHEITVVTSLPWYRGHRVDPEWRGRPWRTERTDWGRIVRVWPFPTDKTNIPARAVGFAGMTSLAAMLGLTVGRHDLVMAMSPPVFLGDAAWLVARRHGVPLVFNIQDVFPDIAVELGALGEGRALDLARRHEKSLYRRADAITVLSEDQARNVRGKLRTDGPTGPATKVSVIHNFVDVDRIRPTERENAYRRRHGLVGKRVVMYSGNVGLSQPFELIREAAQRWVDDPDVVFVINGEGAARPEVDRWASGFGNVRTIDFGPRDQVAEILGAADLHLVILRRGLARSSTPSKLYGILASGRPVLASIDEGSEVPSIIKEAEAGRAVPPEDAWAFCTALGELLADPAELEAMGHRARSFATSWLTADAQAASYEALFSRLLDR
ncbi:MAG: glycosyltransferase family 4 protein, partial [Actinomycetota bacterium]